ncbi:MAG: TonB-dependent receptor, partial [Gemmatimonadota bacterium]|nr:TonB-dependent receptor [Gemmatimonadota bacterium]
MPLIAACLLSVFVLLSGATAARGQGVQTGSIAGRVTDSATAVGITSAAVQLENTRFGAVADVEGHYRIASVPPGTYSIVARRIGYALRHLSVTVVAGQEVTVDFALRAATRSLDEVIVTGTVAGEQRRSIGNAVSTIGAPDALQKSQAPDLGDLLKARAPGVTIAQNTGRLGGG